MNGSLSIVAPSSSMRRSWLTSAALKTLPMVGIDMVLSLRGVICVMAWWAGSEGQRIFMTCRRLKLGPINHTLLWQIYEYRSKLQWYGKWITNNTVWYHLDFGHNLFIKHECIRVWHDLVYHHCLVWKEAMRVTRGRTRPLAIWIAISDLHSHGEWPTIHSTVN